GRKHPGLRTSHVALQLRRVPRHHAALAPHRSLQSRPDRRPARSGRRTACCARHGRRLPQPGRLAPVSVPWSGPDARGGGGGLGWPSMAGSLVDPPSSRRYVRYALSALAGALLFWLLRARGGPDEGGPAPAFDLPVVAARAATATRVSLAEQRGKPLLIEVFAGWCGSCRRAAPVRASAHERYGSDVEFLGISVDEQPEAAALAKQTWQIPYTVAHDGKGAFARSY